MNKRYVDEYREFIYKGEKTPFSLGVLAVVILCVVLLIVATFTKIDISHWWFFNQNGDLTFGIKKYPLVPQIPVIMITSGLLGARFGFLTVFLYLLAGFFLYPVFGFGGGIEYVKSYFFGYILGFFAAVIFAGRILSRKYDIKSILYASVIGVLSIHICGILYSFILSFFTSSAYSFNFSAVMVQIAYDIVFSVISIIIARPLKYVLWIAMKNEPKNSPKKAEQKN